MLRVVGETCRIAGCVMVLSANAYFRVLISKMDGHADLYPRLMLIIKLLYSMFMIIISMFENDIVFDLFMYRSLLFYCFQIYIKNCSVANLGWWYAFTRPLFNFVMYVVTLHKQRGKLGKCTKNGKPI